MTLLKRMGWTLIMLLICAVPRTLAGDGWQYNVGQQSNNRRAGTSEASTSPSSLTGRWEGTWHRSESAPGKPLSALLTQSDSSLAGEVEILEAPCLPGGTVAGSVDGTTVVFGVVSADEVQAEFEGTVDDSGLSIQGIYQVVSGECVGDTGIWHIVKTLEPCDANGDGTVDRRDARDLLSLLLGGGGTLPGDADCHADGVLNFRDVLAILKAAAM